MKANILVTGASGFVGGAVAKSLQDANVICYGRTKPTFESGVADFIKGELTNQELLREALIDVDVVIHCAARAHVMDDQVSDPLKAYREVNTQNTLYLAKAAALAGVKRLIFLSSIKVNGESTSDREPFTANEPVNPCDPYGISKFEAEESLKKISVETGLEVVIIRPPLVYGPGVKANFSSMMKLAKKNFPLPLGAIHNKRSLVALENLVDLILTSIHHPRAANQTFLVSDDHDLSTTELIEMMTRAAGHSPRMLSVPQRWLEIGGKLVGKKQIIERLCGNLQVNISHTKNTLGWKPPLSVEEGIRRCFDDPDR